LEELTSEDTTTMQKDDINASQAQKDGTNISQVEMTMRGIGSRESFSPETLLLYSYMTNSEAGIGVPAIKEKISNTNSFQDSI